MAAAAATISLLACASSAFAQGEILYGADGASGNSADLLVIDPATAEVVERVGPISFAVTGLAEDPTTRVLYGVTGALDTFNPGHLITVNKKTGAGTVVGDLLAATTNPVADITFTSDGTLYGWSENTDDLVTINKATGAATVVGDSSTSTFGSGIAADSSNTLFGALQGDNSPLFTIDKSTGAVTAGPMMNGPGDLSINALAFNDQGTLFGSRQVTTGPRSADLITINTTTGAITSIGGTSIFFLDALEFVDRDARTIDLKAKKKVKKGKKVKLSGAVSAPTNAADCAAGQSVEVQRKQGGDFVALKTVTTDASGAYSTKQKVSEKTTFRTEVEAGPAFCQDGTSPAKTVRVKKEKK